MLPRDFHAKSLSLLVLSATIALPVASQAVESPFGASAGQTPESVKASLEALKKQAEAAAEPLLKEYVGGTSDADRVRAARYFYANLNRCGIGTYRYASPSLMGGLPSQTGKPLPLYYFHITQVIGTQNNNCIYVDGFVNETGQSVITKCAIPESDLGVFDKEASVNTAMGYKHKDSFNKLIQAGCKVTVDGKAVTTGS